MAEGISEDKVLLHEVIVDAVDRLPAPESVADPSQTRSGGRPVLVPFDTRYGPDGRVEFGRRFDVRRLSVLGHELVLAAGHEPRLSCVLISTSAVAGWVSRRVWFRDRDLSGGVRKQYESSPWSAVEGGPGFNRDLTSEETQDLYGLIARPDTHHDVLVDLTEPSRVERNLLHASRAEKTARQAAFAASMRELYEAERYGWQSVHRGAVI